jgi:hypothetical protein
LRAEPEENAGKQRQKAPLHQGIKEVEKRVGQHVGLDQENLIYA